MRNTIIVDLDGVLVNSYSDQTYCPIEVFDADAFNQAIPDFPMNGVIHDLLIDFEAMGRTLIFLTSRREDMRDNTEAWLSRYGWNKYPLIMRPEGDMREDALYKISRYRSEIRPIHGGDIAFVIDDRQDIVDAFWDELGIPGFCFLGGMSDVEEL